MTDLPQRWRDILSHRSVADKIAVPRHCELAEPGDLPAITAMVQGGVLEFVDTVTLPFAVVERQTMKPVALPLSCDVYQITPVGVDLCDRNGIERR